jgi:hypothetical protein
VWFWTTLGISLRLVWSIKYFNDLRSCDMRAT